MIRKMGEIQTAQSSNIERKPRILDDQEIRFLKHAIKQKIFRLEDVRGYMNAKAEMGVDLFGYMQAKGIDEETFASIESRANRDDKTPVIPQPEIHHDKSIVELSEVSSEDLEVRLNKIVQQNKKTGRNNRYVNFEILGRGGMGVVCRAEDTQLGRDVALKISLRDDEDSTIRFKREAKLTAELDHPNILSVYELGQIDAINNAQFYAMKYVASGKDLSKLGALEEKDALRIALGICYGMSHAHKKGIIHRDLKPANVMLDEDGQVFIADWGLAKKIRDADGKWIDHDPLMDNSIDPDTDETADPNLSQIQLTRLGATVGTPMYMPPEQANPEGTIKVGKREKKTKVDERSDIYTIGAIMYELITMRELRTGGLMAMLGKAANNQFEPVRKIAPWVSRELESIIHKSLRMDPDTRYQNCTELAKDIQCQMDGKRVLAHNYTEIDLLMRGLKKHAGKIVVGTAALAISALGISGYREANRKATDAENAKKIAYAQKGESDAKATAETARAEVATKGTELANSRAETAEKTKEVEVATANFTAEQAKTVAAEEKRKLTEEAKIRAENRNKAVQMIWEAKDKIRSTGNLEEAIKMLTEAHNIDAVSPEPLYERGMANYLNELPFQAIRDFVNADKLSKETTGLRHIPSLFYAGLANIVYFERLKESGGIVYRTDEGMIVPDAEFFFSEIEKIPGDKDQSYRMNAKSMRLFSQGKFEEAYQLAEKTKNENPGDWVAHWYLGVLKSKRTIPTLFTSSVLEKQQNGMDALKYLSEAISLERNFKRSKVDLIDAYLSLALTERGDDRALVLVRQLIADEVKRYGECKRPSFFLYEAIGFQQRGDYAESNSELELALKYDKPEVTNNMPHKPHILAVRGKNKHMLKDFSGAEKDYSDAIALSEQLEKTQKDAGYVQRLTRAKAESLSHRGLLKANLEEALKDHNTAVELLPKWADAYMNRGATYEKIGQQDKAIQDYQEASKLGQQEALMQLGALYAKTGKRKEARATLKQYLDHPKCRQKEEALELWEKITNGK